MTTQDYTFILAGKFGVGKTSIFRRIQTGEFTDNDNSMLLDTGPRSGGSEAELEHHIYNSTLNGIEHNVSHAAINAWCSNIIVSNKAIVVNFIIIENVIQDFDY